MRLVYSRGHIIHLHSPFVKRFLSNCSYPYMRCYSFNDREISTVLSTFAALDNHFLTLLLLDCLHEYMLHYCLSHAWFPFLVYTVEYYTELPCLLSKVCKQMLSFAQQAKDILQGGLHLCLVVSQK